MTHHLPSESLPFAVYTVAAGGSSYLLGSYATEEEAVAEARAYCLTATSAPPPRCAWVRHPDGAQTNVNQSGLATYVPVKVGAGAGLEPQETSS